MATAEPRRAQFDSVPLVDYADLARDREKFMRDLRHALCNVGFMVLANAPGFERDFQERAFAAAHAFFDLPQEEKDMCDMVLSPHCRGYARMAKKPGAVSLATEAYQFGREMPALEDPETAIWQRLISGPNIWPQRREMLAPVEELYARYLPLSLELGHLICELLQVDVQVYDRFFSAEASEYIAAMNHSLAASEYSEEDCKAMARELEKPRGAGAHIDGAPFVTLLIGDQPGLEVLKQDGKTWVDVPQVPGGVTVNIGGTLQYLSRRRMVATMHRVNPLKCTDRRISLPFFLLPRLDEPLVPFDGQSPAHPRHRGIAYAYDRMKLFPQMTQRWYADEFTKVEQAFLEDQEKAAASRQASSRL